MKLTPPLKYLTGLLLGILVTAAVGKASAQPSLPPGARLRLGTLEFRHTNRVYAVGFPADGKTLLSAGGSDVILWNLKTGKKRQHLGEGPLLAISPDGKTLALGWEEISIVDVTTGKELCHLPKGKEPFRNVAFNADGTRFLTAANDRTLQLWETAGGKLIRHLKSSHRDEIKAVALSPDGKSFFSLGGHVDRTLQLWDTATGKPTHQLPGIDTAVFAPDGRTVLATHGGELIVWETATGKELKRFRGSSCEITAMALAPDGKTLAIAGYNDVIRLWDLVKEKQVQRLPWVPSFVDSLAFSGDGKTLAAGGWGNTVRLWDWHAGQELFGNGHQGGVSALAFAPDGKTLTSLGWDHTIRLWSLPAGKQQRQWGKHQEDPTQGGAIDSMLGCPEGRTVLLGNWNGYLRLLDLNTGKERAFKNNQLGIRPIAISRDGLHLLTITSHVLTQNVGLTLTLWDMSRGEKVRHFVHAIQNDPKEPRDHLTARIDAVALAPDGKTFASAWVSSRQERMFQLPLARGVSLWDLATGKEHPLNAQASTLAFLDQGKTLVAASEDREQGVIQFWDVATRKLIRKLEGPAAWGGLLTFSPDGKLFATASGPGKRSVYLWRTDTGQELQRFSGHRNEIHCLAFSSDGRMLASGSSDTTILLWEIIGYR